MPLSDPLEKFALDASTALLVDRRCRHAQTAADAGGLILEAQWVLSTPVGGDPVHAALLSIPTAPEGGSFPRVIAAEGTSYVRLVDRFYLPEDPGPELSAALFDVIAANYDRLTKFDVNMAVAQRLLQELRLADATCPIVLDFGCGTGVAVLAAAGLSDSSVDIVGTDASPAMLEIAFRRGERTMTLREWRDLPDAAFDGAIAAFVLHYGIPREDLARIARQLRPGARFAANFFKPRPAAVDVLCGAMLENGLVLEKREFLGSTDAANDLLVFVKALTENTG
jgi:SAM-dependent methyltransferase